MSQSEQQRIAEQARRNYRQAQVDRRDEITDLAPVTLAAGVIADPNDNTLFSSARKVPLAVTVQAWTLPVNPHPEDRERVFIQWAPAGTTDYQTVDQMELAPPFADHFPLTLHVPPEVMGVDGAWDITYLVIHYNSTPQVSAALTVLVDNTEPWHQQNPPKLVMPGGFISEQTLIDNPEGIVATLPAYADRQPGDQLFYWWATYPVPDDPLDIPTAGRFDVLDEPMTFKVTPEVIRAVGDGGCYITYVLLDKALNRSQLAIYEPVAVALGTLPENLAPPQVPLAEGDNLIDMADAGIGVVVKILEYVGWKARDRIEIKWGNSLVAAEELGSVPGFPVQVRVPPEILKAEYGAAVGELETSVSYRILRGTVPFDAPEIKINVDFSHIGPPRPDPDLTWPDPVNPNLGQLDTYGNTSEAFNELTPEDNGQPAKQNIILYAPVAKDELIEFYWGDQLGYTYTVQGFEVPGQEIGVEIPWEIIQEVGNGPQVPVHYRIGAPDGNNKQHSKTYHVKVDAFVLTPEAPEYVGRNEENGWLTCISLFEDFTDPHPEEPAVRVRIPDLSKWLKDGDTVTVTWTPWNSRFNDEGAIIEEAIFTGSYVIGAEHPASGFLIRVHPYERHILPTFDEDNGNIDGRAYTKYSFELNGVPVTSLEVLEVVSMHQPGGFCPLPEGKRTR